MALQKVVHILSDTGCVCTVLSYTLPECKEEVCRILVLEQKINLINEDKGLLTLCSVLCDSVQNTVKDDKHTDRHKLLAEVENVITDKSIVSIYICLLCKSIQRTVSKQLNSKSDFLCFRLILFEKFISEILQGRNLTGIIVLLIGAVNACSTTVNDGLLLCSEICTADKLFAKGHNKLGFQDNRICSVAIVLVHIHCIDMVIRCCGDIDNLATKCIYKMGILPLRVDDDYISIGRKDNIFNLPLSRKRLTATGYTENKGVTVKKLFSVGNYHIFTDNILTVINAVLVVNILNPERNKHCKALGRKSSECVYFPCTVWHNGIESVHLLKFKNRKLTKMFSRCCEQRFRIVVELLFGICGMHHCEHCEHHSLVTGGKVIKELFHFLFLLFHIIRNSCRKVVVHILLSLPVRDVGFYTEQSVFGFSDCFIGRNRYNINGHHQISVHIRKFRHHTVLDIGRIFTKKDNPAITVTDFEIITFKF